MTGKDKKMNFPIIRNIRLNQKQNEKWDPKSIRAFLEGKAIERGPDENSQILLKALYNLMSEKMDFIETPSDQDIEIITKTKEVIV